MDFAYYNGNYLPLSEHRFPVCDRAVFFGDGVYDAMLGHKNRIHLEEEHLERFYKNLDELGMHLNEGKEALSEILHLLLGHVEEGYAFLYVQASRVREARVHSAYGFSRASLFAYAKAIPLPDCEKRLSLVTYSDERYGLCHIKTVNLLPNVLAASYAEQMRADEAIFVDGDLVRECSHSSISILVGNTLMTHPLDRHILPGIMRAQLIQEANALGLKVLENAFHISEAMASDGVFITSTTKRCALAEYIDHFPLKEPSEMAKKLWKAVNASFFSSMEDGV